MISSASVLATERSRAPSHDGQMRYESRLFFKPSQYNISHGLTRIDTDQTLSSSVKTRVNLWLVTLAAVVSSNHTEAVLIFG